MPKENVPEFGNLEADLEAVGQEVLPDITPEIASDRRAVVRAFTNLTADRLELGQAINSYRLHFKVSRSWLRIANVLGRQLGRSRSTFYKVMHDAERACGLTRVRRAALRAEGIESARAHFAPILSRLAGGPEDETAADARLGVQAAITSFRAQKASCKGEDRQPPKTAVTLNEFADQDITRVAKFAEQHGDLTHRAIADAMMERIQAWAGTYSEVEKAVAHIALAPPAANVSPDSGNTSFQNDQMEAAGHDGDRSESEQPANAKRPPAPASLQQRTLFDNLSGGIA